MYLNVHSTCENPWILPLANEGDNRMNDPATRYNWGILGEWYDAVDERVGLVANGQTRGSKNYASGRPHLVPTKLWALIPCWPVGSGPLEMNPTIPTPLCDMASNPSKGLATFPVGAGFTSVLLLWFVGCMTGAPPMLRCDKRPNVATMLRSIQPFRRRVTRVWNREESRRKTSPLNLLLQAL